MPCSNLRGEMAKRRITIESIAELLGVHRNSIANKINGDSAFSVEQAMMIQERLFPDLDMKYLFRRDETDD